jgi:hypothetical protein
MHGGGVEGQLFVLLDEFQGLLEGLEVLGAAVEEVGEGGLVEGGAGEFKFEHLMMMAILKYDLRLQQCFTYMQLAGKTMGGRGSDTIEH